MAYIGNAAQTAFTSFDKQTITGDGTAVYTLSHAVANDQEVEVFVNNVRQEGGTGKAYTVSGNQITFSENIASTDDCYVVFQGKAVQTVTPSAGSVTSAMLASGVGTITKNASDPALNTGGSVGDVWLNTTSGEMYALTDATTDANVWKNIGDGAGEIAPFSASGGTITTSGIYTFHTFTSSGTFTVSSGSSSADILMVAGGGGGGAGYYAGGGGAGGMQALTSVSLTSGTFTVTIGAGGAGSTSTSVNGVNGGNTSFTGQSDSVGGGGGASRLSSLNGSDGGSGGGGAQIGSTGGAGTSGQGNDGGEGGYGGAGGGAGAVGEDASGSPYGANGGDGLQWSPNSTYYAGGGGGGAGSSQTEANVTGGQGGGGTGSRGSTEGTAGTANTGGGGGGGSNREHSASGLTGAQAGKAGGSGIVIIRYET